MQEEVNSRFNVCIELHDLETGQKTTHKVHNLVVNSGLNLLRDALLNGSVSPITKIGFGTNDTVAELANTGLVSELFKDNLLSVTAAPQSLVCQYYLNEFTGNGQTLREAGLFTTSNVLYARVVLPEPIEKSNLVTASFTWTLDWGAS